MKHDAVRDGRHLMQQEDTGRPRIAINPKSFTLWLDPNEPWERGTMADELPDHPNYRYPQERTGDSTV